VLGDLMENRSFWGSGRPRAAQNPFEKVGGKAPYLLKSGPPGTAQNPKMTDFYQIANPPLLNHRERALEFVSGAWCKLM